MIQCKRETDKAKGKKTEKLYFKGLLIDHMALAATGYKSSIPPKINIGRAEHVESDMLPYHPILQPMRHSSGINHRAVAVLQY